MKAFSLCYSCSEGNKNQLPLSYRFKPVNSSVTSGYPETKSNACVLVLSTSSWTDTEFQTVKGYIEPSHTHTGCVEEIGTSAVLSWPWESMHQPKDEQLSLLWLSQLQLTLPVHAEWLRLVRVIWNKAQLFRTISRTEAQIFAWQDL